MKQNIEFIKKLRRLEIAKAIKRLRQLLQEEHNTALYYDELGIEYNDTRIWMKIAVFKVFITEAFKKRNDFKMLSEAM